MKDRLSVTTPQYVFLHPFESNASCFFGTWLIRIVHDIEGRPFTEAVFTVALTVPRSLGSVPGYADIGWVCFFSWPRVI